MKKKFFSIFAFRCFDAILEHADEPLTEDFIKQLHEMLKSGTSDS